MSRTLSDKRSAERLEAIWQLVSKNVQATAHLTKFVEEILVEQLVKLGETQEGIRVSVMERIDRMQGTIDMLREDMRVNWGRADFAISNSKNVRGEVDMLLTLISQMERRHQTLAAQVEELRNRDASKG